MFIWLLRRSHTEASAQALAEPHRFLSAEGRRIVRAIGNKLQVDEQPRFDRVVTSPAVAAVQTAELFAERVDHTGVIDVLPALSSTVPPHVLARSLLGGEESICVVGDEPV